MIEIRTATPSDEAALVAIDRATWSPAVTPTPRWDESAGFFGSGSPADVLVAVRNGELVGYARLGHPSPLESHRHVLAINGLAVDPIAQRQGVGQRLLDAAVAEATLRGARRLTLRVLGTNRGALALYGGSGFIVEGTLPEEFFLAGQYVDDVFMGLRLPATTAADTTA